MLRCWDVVGLESDERLTCAGVNSDDKRHHSQSPLLLLGSEQSQVTVFLPAQLETTLLQANQTTVFNYDNKIESFEVGPDKWNLCIQNEE